LVATPTQERSLFGKQVAMRQLTNFLGHLTVRFGAHKAFSLLQQVIVWR
jgi:hypothetical protein